MPKIISLIHFMPAVAMMTGKAKIKSAINLPIPFPLFPYFSHYTIRIFSVAMLPIVYKSDSICNKMAMPVGRFGIGYGCCGIRISL